MRRTIKPILILSLLASSLSGCGPDKIAYYQSPKLNQDAVASNPNLSQVLGGAGKIDLIWVIDNSGSMGDWQKAVIDNTEVFMTSLIQKKIKWKIGLISTDETDSPYLGIEKGTEFDSTTIDPVGVFGKAVKSLGTSGSGQEKIFTPLLNTLRDYPDFLRNDTPLAIIIVTDAPEQSRLVFSNFYKQYLSYIGDKEVYLYGVFGAQDSFIGCPRLQEDDFIYKGSPYETFFSSAKAAKVYPICSPDFGQNLAKIGEDIALKAGLTKIFLDYRPKISTLRLMNGDKALPKDTADHSGVWFYDFNLNAVCIHDADSIDQKFGLKVLYEKDDGYEN